MKVYLDSTYEFLFHPYTKEAFAHMNNDEDIVPLSDKQIKTLEKRGYTVMDRKKKNMYLNEYIKSTEPLSGQLIEEPRLKGCLILENHPYIFTSDELAFCRFEDKEFSPLSKMDLSWMEEHGFEILNKKSQKKEIIRAKELWEDIDSESEVESVGECIIVGGSDSDAESEVDSNVDSESEVDID